MSYTEVGFGREEQQRRARARNQEIRYQAADLFIKAYGGDTFHDFLHHPLTPERVRMDAILRWIEGPKPHE